MEELFIEQLEFVQSKHAITRTAQYSFFNNPRNVPNEISILSNFFNIIFEHEAVPS